MVVLSTHPQSTRSTAVKVDGVKMFDRNLSLTGCQQSIDSLKLSVNVVLTAAFLTFSGFSFSFNLAPGELPFNIGPFHNDLEMRRA